MNTHRLIAAILGALLVNNALPVITNSVGAAEKPGLSVPGVKPQIQLKGGAAPGEVSRGNINITDATISAMLARNMQPLPRVEIVNQNLERYREAYARYFEQRKAVWDRADHCRTRAYTPQEQQAANCRPSDTLKWCEWKLFVRCMNQDHRIRRQSTYLEMGNAAGVLTRLIDDIEPHVRKHRMQPRDWESWK